jgi:acetylornithine deacetylase
MAMLASSSDPVSLLTELVSFRSDHAEGEEGPLAAWLADRLSALGPDDVTVGEVPRPLGKPSSFVLARFGTPRLLVNAHLDTVPPNSDWSADPCCARLEGSRLYALGAADTKGAIAAILSALAAVRPQDTAVLFSGDEELSSVVMRDFVTSPRVEGLERAIVCEPTNLRVGVRHRGFVAFEVSTRGPGGHSSRADTLAAPIAQLSRVAVALDDWGRARRSEGPAGFLGMCMNLAKLDGGVAFNVVPAYARLLVSLRPPPGANTQAILEELRALVHSILPEATMTVLRDNAPFATRDVAAFETWLGERARSPLDLGFWTEAALLSASGVDTVVFGPGSIEQAHAPDEWVDVSELCVARDVFVETFRETSNASR